jgi:hypothetical protein
MWSLPRENVCFNYLRYLGISYAGFYMLILISWGVGIGIIGGGMAGLMSSVSVLLSLTTCKSLTCIIPQLILESHGFHNFEIIESSHRVGGYVNHSPITNKPT